MGSSDRSKTSTSSRRSILTVQLARQMSEVISLREKVTQAELAAQVYEARYQSGKEAPAEK
jgi:hypothetical protein